MRRKRVRCGGVMGSTPALTAFVEVHLRVQVISQKQPWTGQVCCMLPPNWSSTGGPRTGGPEVPNPGTRVPGYPGTRVSGYLGIRALGYPDTWVPGYPSIQVPGYPGTRVSAGLRRFSALSWPRQVLKPAQIDGLFFFVLCGWHQKSATDVHSKA